MRENREERELVIKNLESALFESEKEISDLIQTATEKQEYMDTLRNETENLT